MTKRKAVKPTHNQQRRKTIAAGNAATNALRAAHKRHMTKPQMLGNAKPMMP